MIVSLGARGVPTVREGRDGYRKDKKRQKKKIRSTEAWCVKPQAV